MISSFDFPLGCVRETEIATFRGIPLFLGVSKKGNNGEMASIRQAQVMSIVR